MTLESNRECMLDDSNITVYVQVNGTCGNDIDY